MLVRLRTTALIAALAIMATGTAGAQEAVSPADAVAPAPAVAVSLPTISAEAGTSAESVSAADKAAGPLMSATAIAARADMQVAGTEEAAAAMFQSRDRRGTTLMLVGGAAFLAGLLIGDDAGTAVALGGAIVGIYGLYLYMQ